MNTTFTDCDCCNSVTAHIAFDTEFLTANLENNELVVHLDEEEITELYLQLKSHVCR